ncbi:MAG: hypothetical protein QF735_09545, partial [Phycisphaeraceae bacterium]|nr:hypothetical protein [Phycisphaeraceae bacterium]
MLDHDDRITAARQHAAGRDGRGRAGYHRRGRFNGCGNGLVEQGKPARLTPSSVTTLIKGANGSSVTTVQTLGANAKLRVARRT